MPKPTEKTNPQERVVEETVAVVLLRNEVKWTLERCEQVIGDGGDLVAPGWLIFRDKLRAALDQSPHLDGGGSGAGKKQRAESEQPANSAAESHATGRSLEGTAPTGAASTSHPEESDWQYEHHMEQCAHGGTLMRIDRLVGALKEINGHIGSTPENATTRCIREVVERELERGDADEAARIRSEHAATHPQDPAEPSVSKEALDWAAANMPREEEANG